MDRQYEEERDIKIKYRTKWSLAVAGLAAILIGSTFALKKLDVDMKKYFPFLEISAFLGIAATSGYYGLKEVKELRMLEETFERIK